MVQALLQITQAANVGTAGQALKGNTAATVVWANADNTGVVSWRYELLYVPPGSAVALTTQGPGATSTYTMGAPTAAKPGSYRVRLTVTDALGNQDVDIRNFCVPTPNRGWLIPPDQRQPPPLPLVGTGSKPDECNYGGQAFGWTGDTDATRKQLYQFMLDVDSLL